MASFYNNYYRYYRPYLPRNFKNRSTISEPKTSQQASPDMDNTHSISSEKEKSSRYYRFGPIQFNNPLSSSIEEPIFEILGIQLYLDDMIILGLLFFLYQEGVQDEMLYITLILLLIS